jgi:hypothetical protein
MNGVFTVRIRILLGRLRGYINARPTSGIMTLLVSTEMKLHIDITVIVTTY